MTTIVSGGSLKALALPRSTSPSFAGPSPGLIPLAGLEEHVDRTTGKVTLVSRSATYDLMYRRQPALYAVVTLLVKAFARLPLKTYEEGADDDRRRVRAHPLARLLRNPYPRRSAWDLKARLAYDLLVHGKHLQIKDRDHPADPPSRLLSVPWHRVETIYDDLGIIGFAVWLGGKRIPIPVDDTVYYELPEGVAPVEVLRRTLSLEDAAQRYQSAALENGVTPRAAFTFKNLNPQDRDFVRAEIEKLYGGPDNTGRFALLTDATVSAIGVSATDLALIEQRKLSRDECCAVYNVNQSIVGWTGEKAATYASAKEFHSGLYVDALGPILTMVEETMQAQLVDVERAWDGLFVEFDLNELLRPDVVERMRAYLMGQQSSTFTIDDRRRSENLPAFNIAGVTDVPLVPVNMRPAAPGMFASEPSPASPADATTSDLHDQLVLEAMRGGSDTAPTGEDDL